MKTHFLKRTTFLGVLTFCLLLASTGLATPTTITGTTDIFGTGSWDSADTTFTYDVSFDGSLYTYDYTYSVPAKGISHLIIGVSGTFTEDNIKDGTTIGWELDTWSEDLNGSSDPGLDPSIFGLKWDASGSPLSFSVTIVTDRAPIPGDFYSKDGKDNNGNIDVYAYNSGHVDPNGAFILVPDTTGGGGGGGGGTPVPEPATLVLMGFGLLGLGFGLRKKNR